MGAGETMTRLLPRLCGNLDVQINDLRDALFRVVGLVGQSILYILLLSWVIWSQVVSNGLSVC